MIDIELHYKLCPFHLELTEQSLIAEIQCDEPHVSPHLLYP